MTGNYAALKAELGKPEYASLSDQQAADALNAEVKVRYAQKVPIGWIQQAAMALDKLEAIQGAIGTNPYAAKTYWLWTSTRSDFPPVNMQDPKFQENLDGLVAAKILSDEDRDAILDLSATTTTKAKQVAGWEREVSVLDVTRARPN